jgi:hypothetical protein
MNKLFLIKQLYVASDMFNQLKRFEQAMHEAGMHNNIYQEYQFQEEAEFVNDYVDILNAGSKEPLIDFCQKNKHKDTPLGDLCGDILRDEEIMAYTNVFPCMAKLIGMSDEPHLKKPIKQLFDKMPESVNNFYRSLAPCG